MYSTRQAAIAAEIILPIVAGAATADEYDIDAIADACLGFGEMGFCLKVDVDEFWVIVEGHQR